MVEGTTPESGWRALPFYARTTIVALLVYALIFEMAGVLFALGGDLFLIVFGTILAVPSVIFAGLVWRFGSWALIVAVVWALLNLLMHAPFTIPAMGNVNSFFDFGLVVPLHVALIIAIVAGVVAFVQSRRGTARTASTSSPSEDYLAVLAGQRQWIATTNFAGCPGWPQIALRIAPCSLPRQSS